MTCTVTALKNVLWNQPTAASGNYFGRSKTLFPSSMELVELRAVPWGFQLEEVVYQCCISAACTSTVLVRGMETAWEQAPGGGRNIGVLFLGVMLVPATVLCS